MSEDGWRTWGGFFASMPLIVALRMLFTLAVAKRTPDKNGQLVSQPGGNCLIFIYWCEERPLVVT